MLTEALKAKLPVKYQVNAISWNLIGIHIRNIGKAQIVAKLNIELVVSVQLKFCS